MSRLSAKASYLLISRMSLISIFLDNQDFRYANSVSQDIMKNDI
jgi:hypothetical protein